MRIRFLMGMFLALFYSSAFADDIWTTATNTYAPPGPYDSPAAACAGWYAGYKAGQASLNRTVIPLEIRNLADSTPNTGMCYTKNSAGGTSTLNITKTTGCFPGKVKSQTWSIGWSAGPTPTGSEPLVTPPVEYCDGTCLAGLVSVDAAGVDTTASPNGSYEMTADATYSQTGQTCTTQTPQPPVPDPPPPGTGDGDGDGTGDGTGGGDPDPDPDPPLDSDGDGTPDTEDPTPNGDEEGGGGSSGVTCTLEQQELGACTCTVDQQTAGTCNTGTGSATCTRQQSIEGLCSCTTPTGGATLCGTGSGGGGTDPVTTDPAKPVCGGPGLPACAVKVDETGTPNPENAYAASIAKLNGAGQNLDDLFTSTDLNKTALPGTPWTFQMPVGSCSPLTRQIPVLGTVTIDLCNNEVITMLRALWAWAFSIMGALYIWRSFTSEV